MFCKSGYAVNEVLCDTFKIWLFIIIQCYKFLTLGSYIMLVWGLGKRLLPWGKKEGHLGRSIISLLILYLL